MGILEKKKEVRNALAAIPLRGLAEKAGLSAQTVSNYFTEKNTFPISEETKYNIEQVVRESLEERKQQIEALLKEEKTTLVSH